MAEIGEITTGDRTIDILHPGSKEKLGITVSLMHIDDDRLKKIKRRITDERIKLSQRGKAFKAEELEENTNFLLFSAMTGWNWGVDADGNPNTYKGETPEFDRKTVIAVLDEKPWFADQVGEAVGETEAFFPESKPI